MGMGTRMTIRQGIGPGMRVIMEMGTGRGTERMGLKLGMGAGIGIMKRIGTRSGVGIMTGKVIEKGTGTMVGMEKVVEVMGTRTGMGAGLVAAVGTVPVPVPETVMSVGQGC